MKVITLRIPDAMHKAIKQAVHLTETDSMNILCASVLDEFLEDILVKSRDERLFKSIGTYRAKWQVTRQGGDGRVPEVRPVPSLEPADG